MSLSDLLDAFEKGQVTLVRWTVPEGLTRVAIAAPWEAEGFGTAAAFQEAFETPDVLKRYGLEDKTVEGLSVSEYLQVRERHNRRESC